MREILRLSLTLAVVGIVSAVLLTGVNGWTEPEIARRQYEDYLQMVGEYFPAVADFETKEQDGNTYDLVYDGAGNLLGVVGTIVEQGYGGPITYNLIVNAKGTIEGIRIISHAETAGLGDIITKPEFQQQFTGKKYDQLDGIDTVSGATVSSGAMIRSIRTAAEAVTFEFFGAEEEYFDFSAVPDGTYEGSGQGKMGEITVAVTVEGGRIAAIEILENEETPTYFVEAYPEIADRIIEAQRLEVDTQTGATASADGIVEAVRDALEKALEAGGGEEDE